jgi:DNA uptake protein ComE-like DNA-binding protein
MKHGNFKRTEDLIAVRGFSARRYRQIAHLLRVTQP